MDMRQKATAPIIGDKYDQIHQAILYFLDKQGDEHVNLTAIVQMVQQSVKVSRNTIVSRLEDLIEQKLVQGVIPPRTHRVRYQIRDRGRAEVVELRKQFFLPVNAVISEEELKVRSQGKPLIINLTARVQSEDGRGPTFAFTLMDLALLQDMFENMGWAVGITDGQLVVVPPREHEEASA
jgi:DNA-binding PadR family transcriptional regulator